ANSAINPPPTTNGTKFRPVGNGAPGDLSSQVAIIRLAPQIASTTPIAAVVSRPNASSGPRQRPAAAAPSAKRKCVSWRTPTAAPSISAIFSSSKATGSVHAAGESSTYRVTTCQTSTTASATSAQHAVANAAPATACSGPRTSTTPSSRGASPSPAVTALTPTHAAGRRAA